MKLRGKVLKKFEDKETGKKYAPTGYSETEEYTDKEYVYPDIYVAEKKRYEELEKKGYVGKGELVEEKRFRIEE